jgi:hypothetical protein
MPLYFTILGCRSLNSSQFHVYVEGWLVSLHHVGNFYMEFVLVTVSAVFYSIDFIYSKFMLTNNVVIWKLLSPSIYLNEKNIYSTAIKGTGTPLNRGANFAAN